MDCLLRPHATGDGSRDDGDALGYSIPIRATGSTTSVYVTPIGGVGHQYRGHANTCSAEDSNAVIIHTGELGRKTQVLVRASKAITAGLEIFAIYGPKDKIRFFDNNGCRCHVCGVGSGP